MRSTERILIPPRHLAVLPVTSEDFTGDAFVELSLRPCEGRETCVPRTLVRFNEERKSKLPFLNLSDKDVLIKKSQVVARGYVFAEELMTQEQILTVNCVETEEIKKLFEEVDVGPITQEERNELIKLLMEFRDCIALDTSELGCAKSSQMTIRLEQDKAFSFRPYRMAKVEREIVQDMVNDLLAGNIIRESNSNYSSPVVLVRKKNGEPRMCIDYRKLNSVTVKDNYPLPRIDDLLDRLQGGKYFTSLDLRSGYYQIPMEEASKKYTAFVTTQGQYEFERMPFGLANAPRTFQRYMDQILRTSSDIAAVYIDDVLIHARTIQEGLRNLRKILEVFRNENIKLNISKCSFLKNSVTFLGFEIIQGKVKPGKDKVKAVEEFETPKNVHQIRQFLGLTGFFRHFVKNYALIARPLTALIRKSVEWKWTEIEEQSFQKLKETLIKRPVLALYNPDAITEVHTDASALGLAGILLQYQEDQRLHPVAYFSRQTRDGESKYHSYELETLAVVESLKKFRTYLVGIKFTVVTDCNALKTTNQKKNLIPRIARWWLQIQEFNFEVKFRPGERMKHADALSRNPVKDLNEKERDEKEEEVMHIEQADWVLAGQLTDDKIKQIREVLSRPPKTEYEKDVYKNYALRDGRVYRITARGIQWVVPRGMRQQVVRAAHDDMGHFSVEKTLYRLCESYWFPRMREYVEKYISCCIRCLFNKRQAGRKEGFLHPIPKDPEPMKMVNVDHLGPFPKSKQNNQYIIAMIDGFTKFCFLRAVKSTKTKYVIEFFKDVFSVYGAPQIMITDQGSCFTSKEFQRFCDQNSIRHIRNAVATPRANGQVERLNRTILSALMTTTLEDNRWDTQLRQVQFSINNVPNKSTGRTPCELLFGYKPRCGKDALLNDEIKAASTVVSDLIGARQEAALKIQKAQQKQKESFDKKRKKPRKYKEGDIVLIEKNELAMNTSRKLLPPYSGPFVVKTILPNDRYLVKDMPGTHRTIKQSNYEKVVAVDRIKPWYPPGGVSDDTASESGEDEVILTDPDEKLEASSIQDGRM